MKPRRQQPAPRPRTRLPPAPPGPSKPTEPYIFEAADAEAVQALARGEASADQQKRIVDLVVNNLACTYDMEFRAGGEEARRDSDFAGGKRFVGAQFVKMLNVNVSSLIKREAQLNDPQQ